MMRSAISGEKRSSTISRNSSKTTPFIAFPLSDLLQNMSRAAQDDECGEQRENFAKWNILSLAREIDSVACSRNRFSVTGIETQAMATRRACAGWRRIEDSTPF